MTDILFLELLEAHPGPLAEPIEVGIAGPARGRHREGRGGARPRRITSLSSLVSPICASFFAGHDAPYLVHEDHVILLQPVSGRQHEVGKLGGGRHEHIGDDRVFHVVLQRPLDREPLRGCQERVGADDPDGAHTVGLARDNRFPEHGRMAAGREAEPVAADDACLFLGGAGTGHPPPSCW